MEHAIKKRTQFLPSSSLSSSTSNHTSKHFAHELNSNRNGEDFAATVRHYLNNSNKSNSSKSQSGNPMAVPKLSICSAPFRNMNDSSLRIAAERTNISTTSSFADFDIVKRNWLETTTTSPIPTATASAPAVEIPAARSSCRSILKHQRSHDNNTEDNMQNSMHMFEYACPVTFNNNNNNTSSSNKSRDHTASSAANSPFKYPAAMPLSMLFDTSPNIDALINESKASNLIVDVDRAELSNLDDDVDVTNHTRCPHQDFNETIYLRQAFTTANNTASNNNNNKQEQLLAPQQQQQPQQLQRDSLIAHHSSYYMVEVRAVFLKVGDISTVNERFVAEAFIEATWIDLNLSADELYDKDAHWNPKLYILNSIGELKQQVWYSQYSIGEFERSKHACQRQNETTLFNDNSMVSPPPPQPQLLQPPSTHQPPQAVRNESIDIGCVIVERRRISGQFWQTLDLKNFPADVQNLTITICTPKHENELVLAHCRDRPSCINIKCFADSQEWKLYEMVESREFFRKSVFSNETFSALDLTINAARRPSFYFWNAFFLIFLITLSSLSVFSIRCHMNHSRIQTTSTLLLTLVTFKWIITNRSLPTVSYMTSLDKYSLASLLVICAQILWHSIISSQMDMEQKCDQWFGYYDRVAFLVFCFIFVVIHGVLFFWLINNPYKKRRQLNRKEQDYAKKKIGQRSVRLKSMLYGI